MKIDFATGSTPIFPPIEGVEIVPGKPRIQATLENLPIREIVPKR